MIAESEHPTSNSAVSYSTGRGRLLDGLRGAILFGFIVDFSAPSSRDSREHKNFWAFWRVVQNLVADVYQATSPYIGFVWEHAPTLSQENPLSYGNLLFFGLLGVMIIGKQILLSASQLKRRVQVQLERLEEAQWRNSMQNGAATQLNANQIGQINFYQQSMPPSPSGDWWQRPLGIVGLSIIGGYVVAILAKFTGMV